MRYFESLSWPVSILDSFAVQDKVMFVVDWEILKKTECSKFWSFLSLVEVGKVEEMLT